MYITGPAVGQAPRNAASAGSSSSTGLPNSGSLDSTFAQLLVAQLQSQDPLNPMDPTQFVTQLVGLNTLDAVTGIYQLLQSLASLPSGSGSDGSGAAQKIAGGN